MECFVRVGFEEPSVVSLSEKYKSVEVCVNSTSPGIEEQFFINITSHNAKKFLMAPIPGRLYFEVNQTNLTDIQCFDLSVDFTSSALCQYFPNCTKSKFSLSLGEHNESNRVFIDVDKSTMDVDVQMPERCGCSAQISSSNSSLNGATVAAIVLVTLLVLLAIIVIVMLYRRWRQYNQQRAVAVAHDAVISNVYDTLGESSQSIRLQHLREELQNKNMIYSKDQIQLSTTVGQALFSTVDLERLAREVSTMLSFEHTNVMSLIGVCIDREMPLLIMPFMINGSILHYVKRHKEKLLFVNECAKEKMEEARRIMLNMAYHITKGMEYLSGHKFVHRDLAARNCMIDEKGIVKVADFGLTEDMYCRKYFRRDKSEPGGEEKVPIRWMAPESIKNDIYNEATDVWSFGVTMWEIFTCGNVPYNGIHAMGILPELERGAVLEIPDNKACSDDIYQVMSSCWKLDAAMRPRFSGLVTTINCLLEKDSGYLELLNLPSFEASSLPFIGK
ncbi:Tyrosine-protein kinase transforming protein SEA, partial [Geodia barretti]